MSNDNVVSVGRPDRTDILAYAKYLRATATDEEAFQALSDFKREWHEVDLRDISLSVRRNVEEIMHRLAIIAK